ncbi:hypothetical protein Fmac_008990 [Flemingia macrophylla]|uniref:Uncharacterized protein n=1 Tax=Flemingia macrophylla TaxID=520843 RepID=A0ABD1MYY8_9FABA
MKSTSWPSSVHHAEHDEHSSMRLTQRALAVKGNECISDGECAEKGYCADRPDCPAPLRFLLLLCFMLFEAYALPCSADHCRDAAASLLRIPLSRAAKDNRMWLF